ncbi:unnamed protein product, partial [Mesorhabditis spiculigera]
MKVNCFNFENVTNSALSKFQLKFPSNYSLHAYFRKLNVYFYRSATGGMAASFEFQGRKYVLDDAAKQYKTAFDDCRGALEETAAIFREPGFDTDMNGWKPDHSSQTTKMFYSDRKTGRYFYPTPLTTEKALANTVFTDVELGEVERQLQVLKSLCIQLREDWIFLF